MEAKEATSQGKRFLLVQKGLSKPKPKHKGKQLAYADDDDDGDDSNNADEQGMQQLHAWPAGIHCSDAMDSTREATAGIRCERFR